jgi:hypothetical protein
MVTDAYGSDFEVRPYRWESEGEAFLHRPVGALGAYEHFRNYCSFHYPDLEWNPWFERIVRVLVEEKYEVRVGAVRTRFIALTGCATSGKTYTVGTFAYIWWEMEAGESAVMLTSTTGKAMRQRMWPVIREIYQSRLGPVLEETKKERSEKYAPGVKGWAKEPMGHLINSQYIVQAEAGDDRHSIICQPVESGEVNKAVANIQGQHTPRRMIVIDEANETPEAIYAAIANARKGCRELIVVFIGNATSKLDMHGMVCEPAEGWGSITVESREWRTGGVKDYQIDAGWCFHFDGWKSPNVTGGKTIYPYLYTYENYLAAKAAGIETTPRYWSYDRGMWPEDGLLNTVLTATMLSQHNGYGRLIFTGAVRRLAGLDPGFGGDDCVLRIGEFGEVEGVKKGLQLEKTFILRADATKQEAVDYQLAHQAIKILKDEKVQPEDFGLDSTGTGRGIAAIMQEEWSYAILKVEFGGKPSDDPASVEDPRPGTEVYDRCVTQLWWDVRECVTGGVVKGFTRQEAIEFCGREYETKRGKYSIETKDETKARIRRSPDHADAVAVLVRVARQQGLIGGAVPSVGDRVSTWTRLAQKETELIDVESAYIETVESGMVTEIEATVMNGD